MLPETNVVKPSTKNDSPGLLVRCRFWAARLFYNCRLWAAKLIYNLSFAILAREASWEEDLFASLAPKAGDRVLDFGPGSSTSAISLARRYPEATFVIVDPNAKATERMRLRAVREKLANIAIIHASLPGKLPVNAGSFDSVICTLALHDSDPDQKISIIKELTRVLRHHGTLRAVDFDKPETPGERRILELGRRISGAGALAPHFNGSWVGVLAKGSLSGAIRQSSHSIGIGRISIVKARKR